KENPTYILPTGFGYAFATMALVLFLLAVGYANNLIYIFVFFLISVAVTATVITNKNMDGIKVLDLKEGEAFASERSTASIIVVNEAAFDTWMLEIFFEKEKDLTTFEKLEPGAQRELPLVWTPPRRGENKLPRVQLKSTFPYGLLRAWKIYRKPHTQWVYPARKGSRTFPPESLHADDNQNVGLYRDHRSHQNTDSATRIDWRASVRRQELLVKNFESGEKSRLHFYWAQTKHIQDPEERLSQLCLWVDEASRQGITYSLKIGTHLVSLGEGLAHRRECLEILARVSIEGLS
ncbi:MAG: DUF58 domain-containing protein, partial [Bdellovibrio sp.]